MILAIIGTRGYPYVYGGFETFAKELGERLVKKGIEVHIYCQRGLFKERPQQVNGIHLHYIPTIQTKSLNQIVHSFFSVVHATFSKADVILVVEGGRIVERGTHTELLAAEGRYAELYRTQFAEAAAVAQDAVPEL